MSKHDYPGGSDPERDQRLEKFRGDPPPTDPGRRGDWSDRPQQRPSSPERDELLRKNHEGAESA